MKGIVFTEFLEMVETRFTPAVADRIITACDLPSGGAYTAVGTYAHEELVQLVAQLSTVTGVAAPDLLRTFGEQLFQRFVALYPQFFAGVPSAFAFLARIEDHIHVEVRKLYPEAELPTFTYDASTPGRLTLVYRSTRPFAAFAEGLIRGCITHFGAPITLHAEDRSDGRQTCVCFVLTQQDTPHE
jgi:hypothetical protein